MARLAAVVALGAVHAVAGHVADATARVAGLSGAAEATTVAGVLEAAAISSTALGAVAGNVADLAALVALSAGGLATLATGLGAVTADVAGLAATVAGAGVVLGALGAVTACMMLSARHSEAHVFGARTYSCNPRYRSCSTWQRPCWGSHGPIDIQSA